MAMFPKDCVLCDICNEQLSDEKFIANQDCFWFVGCLYCKPCKERYNPEQELELVMAIKKGHDLSNTDLAQPMIITKLKNNQFSSDDMILIPRFVNPEINPHTLTEPEFRKFAMNGEFVCCFLTKTGKTTLELNRMQNEILEKFQNMPLDLVDDIDTILSMLFKQLITNAHPVLQVLEMIISLTMISKQEILTQNVIESKDGSKFYWTFIGNSNKISQIDLNIYLNRMKVLLKMA